MNIENEESPVAAAFRLSRHHWRRLVVISVLLLIPCFWHRRIEAGDLASHVYNAWLAQLIEKGQAPGLYLARQWNNVLFDFALLKIGNLFGLAAAEKIVVAASVLIFFFGVLALTTAVTRRVSWVLLPCLAMLAYGWTFNVGFFNYYLSLGLSFFIIAIFWDTLIGHHSPATPVSTVFWKRWGRELAIALPLSALVFAAHPQGFAWLLGCLIYIAVWRALPGLWNLALPLAAALLFVGVRLYCSRRFETFGISDSYGLGVYLGNDQIDLYSHRYHLLSLIALIFGVFCFTVEALRRRRSLRSWVPLRLPFELYSLLELGTYVLPDVVRIPLYRGWIGAFALRLTTISAVLGLCLLGSIQLKKWHAAGFGIIALVFFAFLYQDTAVLNRMEAKIEQLVAHLPPDQRVTATIWAPPDSRLPYIVHIVDRACIRKCFSFENYEPSSGEFRIRVRESSPVVSADPDEREKMEAGEHVVQPEDLPMAQIYQCDASDLTWLCLRQLAACEANGSVGYHPPKE